MNEAEGIDPGVGESVNAAIRLAEELGAEVEETSLPRSVDYGLACYYLVAPAEASSNLARYDGVRYGYRAAGDGDLTALYSRTRWEGFGAEPKRRILLGTYALSAGYYDAYYGQAQKVRTVIAQEHAARVRAASTCSSARRRPTVAFRIGEKAENPLAMYLSDLLTIPSNMAGLPGPLDPVRPLRGPARRPAADRPAVLGEHALPRRPRPRAGDRLRLRPGAAPCAELGSGHRPRDPRPAEDADEDVLPLRERLGRGAEHAHVPDLPGAPGHAARPEPHGDRVGGQARPRARLRDRRALALPPQELLLSRPAEGVPDLPVRRPARLRAAASSSPGRTATARSGSCARTWRRTRPRRSTSAARPGASTAPSHSLVDFNRGGTPLVEIVAKPDVRSGRGGAALPAAPPPDGRRARDLGRGDGEGLAPLRRQRLRPRGRGGRLPHEDRAEEHELLQVRRRRDHGRGRASDRPVRGRGGGRAADAPLRPAAGHDRAAPLEGGGARLPLLPRAGPRRGRAACGAGRARARRDRRAAGRADPAARDRGRTSTSPTASSRAGATSSMRACPATTVARSRTCS